LTIEVVSVSTEEFILFDREHNAAVCDGRLERRALSESRSVAVHWGVPCLGLRVDGRLVSINVTNFSKRPRKNAWGKYINWYLSYTIPSERFKGHATSLALHVEQLAVEHGYSRLKSLAGYYPGVRLHMRMGHHFWGIGKGGALIVDTPISAETFPDGIPIEARNALDKAIKVGHVPAGRLNSEADPQFTPNVPRLMDAADIRKALLNPPFSHDVELGSIRETTLGAALERYMKNRR
jgi:hypothetical protein